MLSKKMLKAINEQINREYFSSYLYLSMSTWCKSQALDGIASWLRIQSQEELGHALKFLHYIEERSERGTLGAISAPPAEFKSVRDVFEKTLAHEQKITASINDLCDLADSERDHATKNFLGWFVSEQVEEEASAQSIVDRLALIGESSGSLLYFDKELGKRAKQ